MTKCKEAKFEPKDREALCASERESTAAWNGARERMTKLTKQYDKAKEAERFGKDDPEVRRLCGIAFRVGAICAEKPAPSQPPAQPQGAPRCPQCGSYKLSCINGHVWIIPTQNGERQ